MANLANTLAVFPNGVWENIIAFFSSNIGNYAVAIILVTICIKLLLLPIDYFNRRSSVKMTEVQTKLGPKMQEIKKRYPDPNVQNQKIQELYQKEGFNPMGSCLTMLVVMIVSMGVFFTLFASLNNMAQFKITQQYEQLQTAYVQNYVMEEKGLTTEEEFKQLVFADGEIEAYITTISESGDDMIISVANNAVSEKYKEVKESFLWVKNVWIADSASSKAIPDFKTYSSLAKLSFETTEERESAEAVYESVMAELREEQGVNGFFILAILTGLTAFFNQYLLTKKKKKKENYYTKNGQPDPSANSGKAMLIILPIIMVMFTLSYNSIFSLYIIFSQAVGMCTAPVINHLINKSSKN